MKKLTTILAMTLMAVMTMTVFVSCDVDDEIGNTLSGTWTGRISTYYEDRWGLVGNDYRTTITFYQDGTGEEVDYRSEEHTSELQSRQYLVCGLLLETTHLRHGKRERAEHARQQR